jgi:hypothetical protein
VRKGISKPLISHKTALRWLEKLRWMYRKLKNGMYLNGHERSNVVKYRESFVIVGWDMSNNSIDGITMGQNSHAQSDSQSLVPLDTFASFWPCTMNPPFSRTMSATQDGATRPASQNRRPRVMASR